MKMKMKMKMKIKMKMVWLIVEQIIKIEIKIIGLLEKLLYIEIKLRIL